MIISKNDRSKYSIEERSIAGKFYLKIFLENTANIKLVQSSLKRVKTVKAVNITESKTGKNLTVYKETWTRMSSLKDDVNKALESFYNDMSNGGFAIYNLDVIKECLKEYPNIISLVQSSLSHSTREEDYRHSLDDVRLAVEMLLKAILHNSKPVEKQKEPLMKYLQEKGVSVEMRNYFYKQMDTFFCYQNNHVKHNSDVNKLEVTMIIDISLFLIKTLVSI